MIRRPEGETLEEQINWLRANGFEAKPWLAEQRVGTIISCDEHQLIQTLSVIMACALKEDSVKLFLSGFSYSTLFNLNLRHPWLVEAKGKVASVQYRDTKMNRVSSKDGISAIVLKQVTENNKSPRGRMSGSYAMLLPDSN